MSPRNFVMLFMLLAMAMSFFVVVTHLVFFYFILINMWGEGEGEYGVSKL